MKQFFHFCLLLALAGAAPLTFSSCSKSKTEDPDPTTGSIKGTVSPVGAITKVMALDSGGLTFITTPDASTGAFTLEKLAPGSYILNFTAAPGYATPYSRTINVLLGQTANAGTIETQ